MTTKDSHAAAQQPCVFLGWANPQARRFCRNLAYWLAAMFPDVSLRLSQQQEGELDSILDLRFAVLVLTEKSRGGEWMQYHAGLLEQKLGTDRVVTLILSPEKQLPLARPLMHFQCFSLKPKSILRLCQIMGATAGQTWGKHQSSAFRRGYPAMKTDFNRFCSGRVEHRDRLSLPPDIDPQVDAQRSIEVLVPRDRQGTGTLLHVLERIEPRLEYLLERGAIATMQRGSELGRAEPVYLPVSVYVSTDREDPKRITGLVEALLDAFDMELLAELPTEYGSLYKTFWARTRELKSVQGAAALLRFIDVAIGDAFDQARREIESNDAERRQIQQRKELRAQVHRALVAQLETVASDLEAARAMAVRAGFPRQHLPEVETAAAFWDKVVDQVLSGRSHVGRLIDVAASAFPYNSVLRSFKQAIEEYGAPTGENADQMHEVEAVREWIRQSRMLPIKELVKTASQDEARTLRVGPGILATEAGRPPAGGTMTPDQMIRLAEQPELVRDPHALIQWLPKPALPDHHQESTKWSLAASDDPDDQP